MTEGPDYYSITISPARSVIEPWDITDALGHGYTKGAALKYLLRAGRKPGVSEAEDLQKCIRCLEKRLEEIPRAPLFGGDLPPGSYAELPPVTTVQDPIGYYTRKD